ncbi:MAG: AAA family ATPase, partial [Clostridia bacterium]|nr:AAA family ATPase [Clostridia bacterium]
MATEIKRDLYLNRLIERKQNGLIKVITGIRRCGKSYLLNTLYYNHLINEGVDEKHIIKFAFDSNKDLNLIGENIVALEKENRKVDPNKFMEYIQSKIVDDKPYYLLLDEVQLLDCFESVLNSYLHTDNVDVYVTGS